MSSLLTNRLRSMVGVVTQDHALFNTTIAENIQYGSVGVVSQEDIEEAARQAHAHDFISQLPHVSNLDLSLVDLKTTPLPLHRATIH